MSGSILLNYIRLKFSPKATVYRVWLDDGGPIRWTNVDRPSHRNWSRYSSTDTSSEIHNLAARFTMSLRAHALGYNESIRLSKLLNRCRNHPIGFSFWTFYFPPVSYLLIVSLLHMQPPSYSFKLASAPVILRGMMLQLQTAFIDNIQMDFVNSTL